MSSCRNNPLAVAAGPHPWPPDRASVAPEPVTGPAPEPAGEASNSRFAPGPCAPPPESEVLAARCPAPPRGGCMATRRSFLAALAGTGATLPVFREHAINRVVRATEIAGARPADALADDETYWTEIQRAFDVD